MTGRGPRRPLPMLPHERIAPAKPALERRRVQRVRRRVRRSSDTFRVSGGGSPVMAMTITEKILAAHAGKKEVQPGELVDCALDMVMANDITAPIAIKEFEKVGATEMFDPERVTFVLSHFVPTKDIRSAEQCRIVRDFARKHRMKYFYDEGRGGIEHILLPQEGLALPGDIVLGADSHSCTYGGLGCFGTGVGSTDPVTLEYVKPRAKRSWKVYDSDPDAKYHSVYDIDMGKLDLQVACPYSPDNVKPLDEVAGVDVDQVFIGSCTNARLEDLRIAARIMKGKKVAPYVRCIVIPATHEVFKQAMKEGLIEVFSDAGCAISEATCGPCLGGHNGVLGPDEVCVSTSNRNFPGRMGHVKARVYLASPAVAAATAVTGRLGRPEDVTGA